LAAKFDHLATVMSVHRNTVEIETGFLKTFIEAFTVLAAGYGGL
jgi:hypothetical protein